MSADRHPEYSGAQGEDLLDLAPCGYVVMDGAGWILTANREFLRMVGLGPGDVAGQRSFASLLPVGARIFLETHLWPMLEHDEVVREIALDLLRADGSKLPVLFNAVVVSGRDGSPASIRAVFMETTERHRYERDLLAVTTAAEAARVEAIRLSQILQQTFVPPPPPVIANLRVAATYRPAGDGTVVGGDFYDFFQLDTGNWMIALGDVSGKGVEAAAVTSFVRYTVRALSIEHPDPAQILTLLNRALLDHDTDRYCTLALANLRRGPYGWDIRLSLAGHPPALIRRPGGEVTEFGVFGTAIGLRNDPLFHTVRRSLGSDTVTLYTDGVTDARHDGEFFGEQRLLDLVGSLQHDPTSITDGIASTVLDYQRGNASDDIAVATFQATD